MSLAAKLRQRFNTLKRHMPKKRKEVSTPDDELYIAITEGYFMLAHILIGGHMNVNCQDNSGATALIAVCRSSCKKSKEAKLEFFRFLLKEGANADIIDIFGKTAINYAEESDLKRIREELVMTGLKQREERLMTGLKK